MIQDRTSEFSKAFTKLTLRLSDVLRWDFLHSIRYMRFFEWQDMESVIFLAQSAVYILYFKTPTDPGLFKIWHSHRFVAVVIQFFFNEALLGVLGIRDNWQNNFWDKG